MAIIELQTLEPELTGDKSLIAVSRPLMVNDEVARICQWILFSILCQIIAIFGIGSNIINIICFVKQGFNDPVNISLLGLDVADMGCLVTAIWTNICFTPAFTNLPFEPIKVNYLTGSMIHTTFTRISGWITATITMERCLCIAAPLKVKGIVTSKRVAIVITCIFVVLIASVAPLYVVNGLGKKFDTRRNKTMIGVVYTSEKQKVEEISFIINNIFIPFSSFFVVIVCTIILAIKLKTKTKWLKESATSTQADNISNRNKKVARMVLIISIFFIACFVPVSCGFLAMVLVPGLAVDGQQLNVLILIGAFALFLESINSSVNIFIYYHMSSKYKVTLQQLFFAGEPKITYKNN